ncbi:MAG TPA: hypothetical protein VNX68_16280 [Nitrosopumilaceae archaeon]|jgi:hypothetical protein|nr:hypothetical protein [Nitrosopumilaceae archaeon]
MKLNKEEKKQVLIDVIDRLKMEWERKGEISIVNSICSIFTQNGFTGYACSIIETEDDQKIIYSPAKKGFMYKGELPGDFGGNKTIFRIEKDLAAVLPESLKSELKTVYIQKKTKTWFFPERIEAPSIGL